MPSRRIVLDSGTVYEGEFRDDDTTTFHGFGVLRMTDGGEYRGEWEDGKHHGKGTLKLPSGYVYEGRWSRGKKSGFGVQTDDTGRRYEGEWTDGRQQGVGTLKHRNGDTYAGQWQDGLPHGSGTLTKRDGAVVKGTWLEGKKQATWAVAMAKRVWRYASAVRWMPPLRRWLQVVLCVLTVRFLQAFVLPWLLANELADQTEAVATSWGAPDL